MSIQRRQCFLMLASVVLGFSACSSSSSRATERRQAAQERPTIAGQKAYGPFVGLAKLGATAADGGQVWLTDIDDDRLMAVDGDSGEVLSDRQLDSSISDSGSMAVANEELWATARDTADRHPQVLRIPTGTGTVSATDILNAGRPFGQALRRGEVLVVADYDRRIVAIDPQNGASRVLVNLNVIPDLLQFGPDDTYWVVDSKRARVLRVDAQGTVLADSNRPPRKPGTTIVAGIVTDKAGNAWLAERSAVAALNPAGETILEVAGFTNVTTVLACEGAVVASDVETGELVWLDTAGREQRVQTGMSGRAIACAPNGVWFVTADGYLGRVATPPNR